jgi:pimeloyl-ACP methyl ester carboxylesterase
MVEDIGEVMSGLGIERAALIGCSLGGALACEFTVAHPERVTALIPVASGLLGFDWPHDPRREAADQAAAAGDFDGAATLALEVWAPLRTDPAVDELIRRMVFDNAKVDALPDELFLMPEERAIDHLVDIAAPALIVEGDSDDPAIGQIAALLLAGIPQAEHVVIPNADHLVPLRAAGPFNAAALDFLAGSSN